MLEKRTLEILTRPFHSTLMCPERLGLNSEVQISKRMGMWLGQLRKSVKTCYSAACLD